MDDDGWARGFMDGCGACCFSLSSVLAFWFAPRKKREKREGYPEAIVDCARVFYNPLRPHTHTHRYYYFSRVLDTKQHYLLRNEQIASKMSRFLLFYFFALFAGCRLENGDDTKGRWGGLGDGPGKIGRGDQMISAKQSKEEIDYLDQTR